MILGKTEMCKWITFLFKSIKSFQSIFKNDKSKQQGQITAFKKKFNT